MNRIVNRFFRLETYRRRLRKARSRFLLSFPVGRRWLRALTLRECDQLVYAILLRDVLQLDGDVIECGVFNGESLTHIAALVAEESPGKHVYGLDSFAGFPAETIQAADLRDGRDRQLVSSRFRTVDNLAGCIRRVFSLLGLKADLVPGYFQDALPDFSQHQFCFVHLDCDLYESYLYCLQALYDLVIPGGVIVFDEYNDPAWPGATKAIDEFLATIPETLARLDAARRSNYFARKL